MAKTPICNSQIYLWKVIVTGYTGTRCYNELQSTVMNELFGGIAGIGGTGGYTGGLQVLRVLRGTLGYWSAVVVLVGKGGTMGNNGVCRYWGFWVVLEAKKEYCVVLHGTAGYYRVLGGTGVHWGVLVSTEGMGGSGGTVG